MSEKTEKTELGIHYCQCCCESEQRYNDTGCSLGYMRCSRCGCRRALVASAGYLTLQINVVGRPTIGNVATAIDLARRLGAPEELLLEGSGSGHHFTLSADGARAHFDIHDIRAGRAT